MNVFVTGHRGYIGAHLVALLKEAGHEVTGCDLGLFDGCEWDSLVAPNREIIGDFRALAPRDLDGFDCVMHLAALSNDPMGDLAPQLTREVNARGSIELAQAAKAAAVPRFLFSSSCSIYGKAGSNRLAENAELAPVSVYAESKIAAEEGIAALADRDFSPVFLRNATAYGGSPMLRIDLVANNLLACAVARGDIRILSDGTPWRPLIHCRDIARAFLAALDAPREALHNEAVNIGADSENYQVRDIAEIVQRLVPGAGLVYTGEIGKDPRDYGVDFQKLARLLPDFRLEFPLAAGMEGLFAELSDRRFSAADFDGDRFVRLRRLRDRLDRLTPPDRPAPA